MELTELRMMCGPYAEKIGALETAGQIRDFLVAEGVKGVRREANACAIAQYVTVSTGQRVAVDGNGISAYHEEGALSCPWAPAREVLQHLTAPMCDFITNFDRGDYPELEA